MTLLVLTKKFPFPLKDGESLAIHGLTKSLSELGCEVSLLAMNTSKHFYESKELPPEMAHYREVRTVSINNDFSPIDAVSNLIRGTSYHISRFHQESYHEALSRWLLEKSFDIVQLETLYLAPYVNTIRRLSNAQIVMRSHNVEHEIWERCCENIAFAPKRWYLQHITRQLRDFERSQLNQYDLHLPITQRDKKNFERLGGRGHMQVLPIGLETSCGSPTYESYRRSPDLHFIGSLDWLPNLEGLNWFLNEVWPEIHRRCPEVKFHIAGRNMPHSIRQLQMKQVVIHGEVDSSCKFVSSHTISIVPLLSGGGMRAKILEAMSLGRVVITTTVGLEGIKARNRRDLFIADTPEQFVAVVEECVARGRKLEAVGRSAYGAFHRRYDRRVLARKLLQTYEKLLRTEYAELD
ncbi:glycosyltransferase involved in cell wall biosynthesis [Neolewinella xylanilytica]|uniref:Glycosyltransferase involved in cell wall biosynthesis n=1 Tax=Neolewinella xylanilytica TaxID=1514080 RepID=A0A2S6I5C9_9BACT|nr:glycosyltransferase family 4 protein [Neolewinella xylanilytica]PPK86376.1 glycosyltransferase involved in cell wall biosynthesis [Neolewinella xylanilytica]